MVKVRGTVRLRQLRLTDLPFFVRWWQDPKLRPLTSGSRVCPSERWVARRVVEMINPSQDIHRMILISGKSIGHCALIRRRGSRHELQIMIGEPAMWNKGYGTSALCSLLALGRRNAIHNVMLEVRPANTRAIRAFEKCGFLRTGYCVYPKNSMLPATLIMRWSDQNNAKISKNSSLSFSLERHRSRRGL